MDEVQETSTQTKLPDFEKRTWWCRDRKARTWC